MKTQKHTAGPPVKVQFFDDAGHVVREAIGTRAARIVACVNACEGINPEAVPQLLNTLSDFVESFRREIENDEEISGGDAVEYIANFYQDAIKAIAAATKEG